jgi:hydrogenase nickel incorporation protein HypA/HybF
MPSRRSQQRHEASAAVRIELRIGPLSGVEPHLVEQAFPIASAGTVAADAELVIDSLPVMVRCAECGSTTSVLPNRLVCASCGDWHTTLVSGDELELYRVELMSSAACRSQLAGEPFAGKPAPTVKKRLREIYPCVTPVVVT